MTERPVFRPSSVDVLLPDQIARTADAGRRGAGGEPEHPHLPPRMAGPAGSGVAREGTATMVRATGFLQLTPAGVTALRHDADAPTAARVSGLIGARHAGDLVPASLAGLPSGVEVRVTPTPRGIELVAVVVGEGAAAECQALSAVCAAGLSLVHAVRDADPSAKLTDVVVESGEGA